jgi:hypothetical protein
MTHFAQRRRNAPASLLVGALLAVVSLLPACGGGTPAGGDPGDKRLNQLTSDRVFAALPDGATEVDTTEQPARYRKPGFSGGGWDGPSVVVTFKTSAPPAAVYRFYAQNAESAGWKPTAAGRLGLTDRWAKTYSDGAPATLSLVLLDQESSQRTYRLSGGVAPATS